jgi:hypothetical protein
LLFSADKATDPARLEAVDVVKAEADPASKATERAANFTIFSIFCGTLQRVAFVRTPRDLCVQQAGVRALS